MTRRIQAIWSVQSPQAGVVRYSGTLKGALRAMATLIKKNGQAYRDEYFVRMHTRSEIGEQDWTRVKQRIRHANGRP